MSGEAKYTERDMVLAKREAFVYGVCRWPSVTEVSKLGLVKADAAQTYPLPKVQRPRVAHDPHPTFRHEWRAIDGILMWRNDNASEWRTLEPRNFTAETPTFISDITPPRIALWASLLASPTELVDEPDPGVSS